MHNNQNIYFPTVKSISVYNYPLFDYENKEFWKHELMDGLNLFLGANSIGKTTTINMIIYGIVGSFDNQTDTHFKVNPTYFLERLNEHERRKFNQKIVLEFFVNDNLFEIHRSLFKDEVLLFKFNGVELSNIDYEVTLRKTSNINEIRDLVVLLSRLIIREEEGNYLLWDKEKQSEIILLLLNYSDFQREYKKLKQELDNNQNKYNETKLKYDKRLEEKTTLFYRRQKQIEELKANTYEVNKANIEKQIKDRTIEKQDVEKEIFKLTPLLDNLKVKQKEKLELYYSKKTQVENLKAEIQLKNNEAIGFKFKDNKANVYVEKLKRNECIFCTNTKVPQNIARQIHEIMFVNNECPICTGKYIKDKVNKNIDEKTLVARLNELSKLLPKEIKELNKREDDKNKIGIELENIRKQFNLLSDKLEKYEIAINNFNSQLDGLLITKKVVFTDYDRALSEIEKEIELVNKDKVLQKSELDKITNKFNSQRNSFNEKLIVFQKRLNEIFKSYTSNYFKEVCELVTDYIENKIDRVQPLCYFLPKFNGVKRIFKTKVSQSEAIFLEYLFRISLLELYNENSQHKVFLMIETSEGTFDVANTKKVATLFKSFGNNKFPVVVVTNLSKLDFIDAMVVVASSKRK